MKLQVTPEALNDIAEIKKYFRDVHHNPALANRIADKIRNKYKLLKASPYIGASLNAISNVDSDLRYLVCGNYIILYRVLPDFVEVSRIVDGRRDYIRFLTDTDDVSGDEREQN